MRGWLQDAGFLAADAWDWAMRSRRRALICAALALTVPVPAYALTAGGDEPAPPAALDVSASLDSCGLAGAHIVCMLNVSFNDVPDATRYTASVTRPDGSVIDYGAVGAGGTTVHVPYVGAGTYGVRVSAYGRPERPGEKPVLLDTDSANAEPDGDSDRSQTDAREVADPGAGDAKKADAAVDADGGQDGGSSPEAGDAQTAPAAEAAQPGPEPCIPVESPAVSPTVEEPTVGEDADGGPVRDEDDAEDGVEPEPSPEDPPAPAAPVTPEPADCLAK